jgi:uncharacterized protein YxjI
MTERFTPEFGSSPVGFAPEQAAHLASHVEVGSSSTNTLSTVRDSLREVGLQADFVSPVAQREHETQLHPGFLRQDYTFRQKVLRFLGNAFDVKSPRGEALLHSTQDRLRLREVIHIYSDKSKRQELLTLSTQQRMDLWSEFAVHDTQRGEHVGSLKREWLESGLKDTWTFHGPDGRIAGKLSENTSRRAIASRIFGNIIAPQRYIVKSADGAEVAYIKQWRNPIARKYDMRILQDNPHIDRRMLISAGILLLGVEAQQPSSPVETDSWIGSAIYSLFHR